MSLAPASGQRVPVRTVVGGGRDTHDGHENSPILVFFSNLLDRSFYFLDPANLDKHLGISWDSLKKGRTSEKLLQYLSTIG